MYMEKYKGLLKCKVVLSSTVQGNSAIQPEDLFLVFIKDLFLTPWSLGTSPRFKAVCLGHIPMWRDSVWELRHQDCKDKTSDDQAVGDGKERNKKHSPPNAISTGMVPKTLCFEFLLLLGVFPLTLLWGEIFLQKLFKT